MSRCLEQKQKANILERKKSMNKEETAWECISSL